MQITLGNLGSSVQSSVTPEPLPLLLLLLGYKVAEPGHQFCLPLPRALWEVGVEKHHVTSQSMAKSVFQASHFCVCIPVQLCKKKPRMVGGWSSPPLWYTERRDEGINYSLASVNEESLYLNTQHALRPYCGTQGLLSAVTQTGVCVYIYIYLCRDFLFLLVSEYIYMFL